MKKISTWALCLISLFLGSVAFTQAATILFPTGGGTGTGVAPTTGQVLVGQTNGTYLPVATSTLGISGGSSFGYPFPLTGNATSTLVGFNGGITAGNSTFSGININSGSTNLGSFTQNGSSGLITAINGSPADPSGSSISAGANFGFNGVASNFYGMGLGAIRNSAYDMWFQTGAANGGGFRWYTGTTENMTLDKNGGLTIEQLGSGLVKSTAGFLSDAVSGVDFAPATSGSSILYGNGAGGFSNLTVGTGLTFTGGTLSATGGTNYFTLTGNNLQNNVGNALGINTAPSIAALEVQATSTTGNAFTAWSTAAANLFSILNNGNVGIGTSSPTGTLDVEGGTTSGSLGSNITLRAQGSVNTGGNILLLPGQGITTPGFVGIGTTTPSGTLDVEGGTTVSSLASNIIFRAQSSAGAGGNILLIPGAGVISSGFVGIGTTTPVGTLDVEGGNANVNANSVGINLIAQSAITNFRTGGTVTLQGGASGFGSAAGNVVLQGGVPGTSGTGGNIVLMSGSAAGGIGIGTSTPQAELDVAGGLSSTNPLFRLSSVASGFATTTRLIVTSTGLVGIGTTSPYDALSVVGNEVVTGTVSWPSITGTQCIQSVNGIVSGTGSACGSGGGSGIVNSGLTGQVPFYAAGGTTLTATSSIVIDANGMVGIGTSTPTNVLSLAAGSLATPALSFGDTATGFYRSAANQISFSGAGTQSVVFTNVGINTPSISGLASSNNGVLSTGGSAGGGLFTRNRADTGVAFTINQLNLGSTGDILDLGNASGTMDVFTQPGNLGLGTTSPFARLSVGGNSYLGGNLTATGTVQFTGLGAGLVQSSATGVLSSAALTSGQVTTALGFTPGTGTVTSVAATVPSFLSVSGSPITTSGTLALSYSGTALPLANGGTGLTSIGASSTVLVSNGTVASWQTPASSGYSPIGTLGQFPYFSGTNTLTATSSMFLAASGNVGIGTTSPIATFAVSSPTGNMAEAISGFISTTFYIFQEIDQFGHLITSGPQPSVTGGTVKGNDRNGLIFGGGGISADTLTFVHPYPAAPDCTGSLGNSGNTFGFTSITASGFTVTYNSSITNPNFYYICQQAQ